ncbi:hypothetical protein G7092_27910 [Mucilaginibacter sp. HC2]|uniref:hypothetical protein n=1 Tax=Mucilaginibacter inviolabilis TaxID=2714892 RepID=UPI00140CCD4D|nr:hypothetical protein [Mucilaginibacter inviolabilis]NHA07657.1 hypothetical protein [Mucilaginibacter inviolabilis]
MKRKRVVFSLQVLAILLLLLSFLLVVAVRLSDKGDVVDRNAGWIVLGFLITLGFFIYSQFISESSSRQVRRKKTPDELINEIKKSNLDKFKSKEQGR